MLLNHTYAVILIPLSLLDSFPWIYLPPFSSLSSLFLPLVYLSTLVLLTLFCYSYATPLFLFAQPTRISWPSQVSPGVNICSPKIHPLVSLLCFSLTPLQLPPPFSLSIFSPIRFSSLSPLFFFILKLTSCSLVMNLSTSVQGVSSISLWGRNHANAEYVTGLEGTQLIRTSWHIPICVTKRWPLVLPWQDCPEWFPQSPQCHLLPLSTPWQSFEVLLESLFKFHTLRPKFQRTYIRRVAYWFRFCFICNLESHYWRI